MKTLTLLICLFSINLLAQDNSPPNDNEIEIQFRIYLDGKNVETDSVKIGYVSINSKPNIVVINNQFTTYFKPNRYYQIVITHPNYNMQILRLKTDSIPIKTGGYVNIYLQKNTPTCNIGELRYNKFLKRYIIMSN